MFEGEADLAGVPVVAEGDGEVGDVAGEVVAADEGAEGGDC